ALQIDHLLRRVLLLVLVEAGEALDVEDVDRHPLRHQLRCGAKGRPVVGLAAEAARDPEEREIVGHGCFSFDFPGRRCPWGTALTRPANPASYPGVQARGNA